MLAFQTESPRRPVLTDLTPRREGLGGAETTFRSQLVHDSSDAILDQRRAEVDQETKSQVEQPKVSQKLLAMNSGEALNRLHFYDDGLVDNDVSSERFTEEHAIENVTGTGF